MKLPQRRVNRPSLGGLMATRQGALALALVCALAATGVLMFALGRYKTNVAAPVTPQTTVLVATRAIVKGTSSSVIASGGMYRAMPIVATQLAPGAISDASALSGKVASVTILPGQQLTAADLAASTGAAATLGPDQRAISLNVAGANADLGLIQTGDRVDVYSQFPTKNGKPFEVLLLRGAQVLQAPGGPPAAAPTAVATAKGTPGAAAAAAASLLTLAVTSAQVPRVVYATQNGQLYLTLRPATATDTPNGVTTLTSVVAASLADNSTGATK